MQLTKDKKIWIPSDDDWITWSENFELDEFNDVMPHISKTDVALDIGAHVGIWSKRLAKRFKKVIAFEPVPKHIECWKRNMSQFGSSNRNTTHVILNEVALSNEECIAPMKVPNVTNSGMASLEHNQIHGRWLQPGWETFPEVEVIVKPLDSFEFDQIDFMKIDVEWFEYNVLQGAIETIKKHNPIIYIEIHDPRAYGLMKDLDLGYRVFYSNKMNRLFKRDTTREYLQQVKKIDNLKEILKTTK